MPTPVSKGEIIIWHSRGTQLPYLSGNSEMRSSLIRSFSGPRMMTGRVYFTKTNINNLIIIFVSIFIHDFGGKIHYLYSNPIMIVFVSKYFIYSAIHNFFQIYYFCVKIHHLCQNSSFLCQNSLFLCQNSLFLYPNSPFLWPTSIYTCTKIFCGNLMIKVNNLLSIILFANYLHSCCITAS